MHRPKAHTRGYVLAMGLFVAAMHVFLLRTMSFSGEASSMPFAILGLILLIDAIFLWWTIIFTTQSHITLYEEGIELQRGGSRLFTSWHNVDKFGIKGHGRAARRGLYLHERVSPDTKGLVDKLIFGRDTDFIPIGQYTHLPRKWTLNPFNREIHTDKLRDTDFGQDVYDLAPHLFEEDAQTLLPYKTKHDLGYAHNTKTQNDTFWQDEDKVTTTKRKG